MVWAAALIFLADGTASNPPSLIWFDDTSTFIIDPKDVQRDGPRVTAWIRSDHRLDKSVAYRTGLQRVQFNCDGTSNLIAFSTYDKSGKQLYSWDGFGTTYHIRPDTMQKWAQDALCKK